MPSCARALPSSSSKIKAAAFDGFALFDARPVAELANALFPGRGMELTNEWRTRQFEYTWLRTLVGRYADFWQVTAEALTYALNQTRLSASPSQVSQLMEGFLSMKAWPDVDRVLNGLKNAGIPAAILSNLTPRMMQSCVERSGLNGAFQSLLSTDQVQAFKPDPRAYALGTAAFNLKREEILFVAFAGWDAAGSKLFGYPTYWVNRFHQPAEELGAPADVTATDLNGVVGFIRDHA